MMIENKIRLYVVHFGPFGDPIDNESVQPFHIRHGDVQQKIGGTRRGKHTDRFQQPTGPGPEFVHRRT